MEISSSIINDILEIRMRGELDESTAEFAKMHLDNQLTNKHFSKVVLDLTQLAFMDSTGIGVVIGRYKLLKKHGKQLYVKNPTATIDKIFKISGLYEIIPKVNK